MQGSCLRNDKTGERTAIKEEKETFVIEVDCYQPRKQILSAGPKVQDVHEEESIIPIDEDLGEDGEEVAVC